MNNHCYVILFKIDDESRIELFIQNICTLGSWFKYTPCSIVIRTNLSQSFCSEILIAHINRQDDIFVVIEISNIELSQGWLPQDAWEWLKLNR